MIWAKTKIGANTACMCMLSHVQLFSTPQTVAHQALLSMESSRQEYWSGLPFPTPGEMLILVGENLMANRTFTACNLSNPDYQTHVSCISCIGRSILYHGATWEVPGNLLQNSCLENSKDRGAWWATVHGATKVGQDRTTGHTHTQDIYMVSKFLPVNCFLFTKGKLVTHPHDQSSHYQQCDRVASSVL